MDPDEIGSNAKPYEYNINDNKKCIDSDMENEEDSDSDTEADNNNNFDNVIEAEQQTDVNETNPNTIQQQQMDETNTFHVTRSGRISKPRDILTLYQSHLHTQAHEEVIYSNETARVIATTICHMNVSLGSLTNEQAHQYVQSYSLRKGLQHFGENGRNAAISEMKQLHDRAVFEPIHINEMTQVERRRAMESLIFLVEKRDGRIKARTCANGSTQRLYTERDEAASPTAMTESILITATIDAKQNRDVMTADIPNAFVQTDVDQKNHIKGERIIMKIRGSLVDMLVEIAPEVYYDFVVYEGNSKTLYVKMLKAIYGMMQSSLLYYKKFRKDIESIGFKINPYDPCVANRIVNEAQHTVCWHVDDLKSSHIDRQVNDKFCQWLEKTYASDKIGKVKAVRGTRHDYLAMILDYSTPGILKVDMTRYVKSMIDDFPEKLSGKTKTPWNEKLFQVNTMAKRLGNESTKIFHTFVMKGMFLCKRGRQDIQPAVAFLATRVTEPNEGDWKKLVKMMNFLRATEDDIAVMSADNSTTVKWHVDASFAVHKDFRSHTGATMSLGLGTICSVSTKQKVNTRSSTEAELVSVDDVVSKILWTKLFIEAQGFVINTNIIYRDNMSSMKLEANGKESSGKRTRHFNIKYFYITDLIRNNDIQIRYCPTQDMIADYMTKPLVGAKFDTFRNRIMNSTIPVAGNTNLVGQKECVG